MVNDERIELTKKAEEELLKEYRHLVDVESPAILEQLKAARQMGDLSENADYDAARNQQAEVEGRIKEIKMILKNAVRIDDRPRNLKVVGVGTKVTLQDLDEEGRRTGKPYKYDMVVTFEADPSAGKISIKCPLGLAIQGHKKGDKVLVRNVPVEYSVEILDIGQAD